MWLSEGPNGSHESVHTFTVWRDTRPWLQLSRKPCCLDNWKTSITPLSGQIARFLSLPLCAVSSFLFYFYFWYLLAEPSGLLSLFISAHTPLPFSPPSPITLFFIPLSHKTMLTLESSCYGPISRDLTSKTEGTIPSLLSSPLVVQSDRRLPLPLRPLCRLESNRVIPFLLLFSRVGLYRGLSPRAILCLSECCTVLLS
jgi:hypothetical protein